MAAAPVKSPLHNFPLTYLKWGSKKDQQRCHSSKHNLGSRSSRNRRPSTSQPPSSTTTPTHDNKTDNINNNVNANDKTPEVVTATAAEEGWNLRPRRATATNATLTATASMAVESSSSPHDFYAPKSTRLRESNLGNGASDRRDDKRFFIALSRDEIEEDVYSMTGSKPSRRPKKRPKNVQKQLDNVFPGLWLVGFTPETYRGFDFPLKR